MKLKGISIIILAAALSACGNKKKPAAENSQPKEAPHAENIVELTPEQSKLIRLETGKFLNRELSGAIKVSGRLDVPPQQMISVSMPFGGILRNTSLLEGLWVKKGQVIAQMEHPDYIQLQQDYLETKAQLGFQNEEFERQKSLSEENVTSRKTYQKTAADHRTLQVRLEALRQKLLLMNLNIPQLEKGIIVSAIPVLAPISGYVTKVNANIGKFVNPNESMFEIVDTEHLHAELTVFEKDIPRLKIGRKVRFVLSNETKERTATVHLIGREIDANRTIRVHCHLDNEDKEMLPGTYLKAWVETGATKVNALPDAAIVMDAGKQYIFVAEGNHHFRRVPVTTGVSEGGYTEVSLPGGEMPEADIVITGAGDLQAKMNNTEEEGHGH